MNIFVYMRQNSVYIYMNGNHGRFKYFISFITNKHPFKVIISQANNNQPIYSVLYDFLFIYLPMWSICVCTKQSMHKQYQRMNTSSGSYQRITEHTTPPKCQSTNNLKPSKESLKKTQLKPSYEKNRGQQKISQQKEQAQNNDKFNTVIANKQQTIFSNDDQISIVGNNIINAMKSVTRQTMETQAKKTAQDIQNHIGQQKETIQEQNKQFMQLLEKKRKDLQKQQNKRISELQNNHKQHMVRQKWSQNMKILQLKYEKVLKQNEELQAKIRSDPSKKQLGETKQQLALVKMRNQKYEKQMINLCNSVKQMENNADKVNRSFVDKCKEHQLLLIKYNEQCANKNAIERQRNQLKTILQQLRKQIVSNINTTPDSNSSTLDLLTGYLQTMKKSTAVLQPIATKIILTQNKKDDLRLSQQIGELKQLSSPLKSLSKMPYSLVSMLAKIIDKLVNNIDLQKLYTREVLKYVDVLETNFAVLNTISNQTIQNGTYRTLYKIVDYNENSSKVNSLIESTVQNMANFGKKLSTKIDQLFKVNKQKEEFKTLSQKQKQQLQQIEIILSKTKQELAPKQNQIQKQRKQAKQRIQKMQRDHQVKIVGLQKQLDEVKNTNGKLNEFVKNVENDRKQLAKRLKAEQQKYQKMKKVMKVIGETKQI